MRDFTGLDSLIAPVVTLVVFVIVQFLERNGPIIEFSKDGPMAPYLKEGQISDDMKDGENMKTDVMGTAAFPDKFKDDA